MGIREEGTVIWIRPETKRRLEELRANGQTFGGFVEDLLDLYEACVQQEGDLSVKRLSGKRGDEREPAETSV